MAGVLSQCLVLWPTNFLIPHVWVHCRVSVWNVDQLDHEWLGLQLCTVIPRQNTSTYRAGAREAHCSRREGTRPCLALVGFVGFFSFQRSGATLLVLHRQHYLGILRYQTPVQYGSIGSTSTLPGVHRFHKSSTCTFVYRF